MSDATNEGNDAMAELTAMTEVAKALHGLHAESIRRILQWATDRFGPSERISPAKAAPRQTEPTPEKEAPPPTELYNEIADLYAAAKPKGDAEKALVVAYWVQRSKGNGDFDAGTINRELKNLGHGIGNITAALGSLIARRPNLVIQTRKTGTSQQARKRYKLTNEGMKYVDRMIQVEE